METDNDLSTRTILAFLTRIGYNGRLDPNSNLLNLDSRFYENDGIKGIAKEN